ncbi:MAG TPA: UDP-N-acetylmuramate--L-alanine ligase [Gemmatimonadales bacterium]|nr:UDP-N-acetylmuramate--L-alanine ligase [Gemmatimonadales bacterium]
MDLFDPADPRPVHFMGIGGAGMSALALVARRRGVAVSGCDPDPSGAADVALLGATVHQGHDPAHVDGARAVVATAAVPPEHPELVRARQLGVPVVPRKEALAQLVAAGRVVGISGTHGKSTTTVMTTEALAAAGLDPTGLAGGRVDSWGGNARLGSDRLFVVESDEYDKAFLTLTPAVAVVNNVEADHLECYGSVDSLEEAFATFAGRAETILGGADDAGVSRVLQAAKRQGGKAATNGRIWRFGLASDADLRISDIEQAAGGSKAKVSLPGGRSVRLELGVPGLHNLRNATAVLGVALALGAPLDPVLGALGKYGGLGRRFERLGEAKGIEFVDDYAHHPTELVATLSAARQAFPGRRLIAVFQPHLFSRTAQHGVAMGRALSVADVAIVTEIYAAREQPLPGVTGRTVAEAAQQAPSRATVVFEPNRSVVRDRVLEQARAGDVVLTMGAGDITRVGRELVAWLRAA